MIFFSRRPFPVTEDELARLWPGTRVTAETFEGGRPVLRAEADGGEALVIFLSPDEMEQERRPRIELLEDFEGPGGPLWPDVPGLLERASGAYALQFGEGLDPSWIGGMSAQLALATASIHGFEDILFDALATPFFQVSEDGQGISVPHEISATLVFPVSEAPSRDAVAALVPGADVRLDEDGDVVLFFGGAHLALAPAEGEYLEQALGVMRRIFGMQCGGDPARLVSRVGALLSQPGRVLVLQTEDVGRGLFLEVLAALGRGLHPLIFFEGVFEDPERRALFVHPGGADGADDPGALDDVPAEVATSAATERQRARRERSKGLLRSKAVPEVQGIDLFVDDDEEARLREPRDVARRVLVLLVVALRAEGLPMEQLERVLKNEHYDLDGTLSPEEKDFLAAEEPDPSEAQMLVWRYESIQALLWALGHVPELPWPSAMADMERLMPLLQQLSKEPEFAEQTVMRPKGEILDALDLTFRQHWAVRQSFLQQQAIPADFDWTSDAPRIPVQQSPAAGILFERHRALNWLVRFGGASWDDVDTPT